MQVLDEPRGFIVLGIDPLISIVILAETNFSLGSFAGKIHFNDLPFFPPHHGTGRAFVCEKRLPYGDVESGLFFRFAPQGVF